MPRSRTLNIPLISQLLGILLIIEAVFMLTALPFSWYYGEASSFEFHFFDSEHDFWPPVAIVLKAWQMPSKKFMPPSISKTVSTAVSRT